MSENWTITDRQTLRLAMCVWNLIGLLAGLTS